MSAAGLAMFLGVSDSPVMWAWASIRPGISVRPPTSTTVAPPAVDRLGRYRRDATVAHQHVEAALQFGEPVEDEMGVDEKRLRHAASVSGAQWPKKWLYRRP